MEMAKQTSQKDEIIKELLELADRLVHLVRHKMPYPTPENSVAIISAADDYVETRRATEHELDQDLTSPL